ncbi:MAG: ATP synthase subunit I [Erysipelotrichaceae bacterium]|nr:ATP synthase subunit I [Erysipelotrichaceae bacterium]
MKIRIYVITAAIAALLAAFSLLIDVKISLGILLSAGFSLINMLMLSQAMKSLIQSGGENYSVMITANIIRFALLLVVIYIAVKNSQLFSILGVAAGFALFLIALIIDAVSRKGR